ncbi:MAG: hypothetical protein HOQ03_00710 [Thermoleophilia bacterium]|nr:hypothetical protein [Thermoleophilia bacterium]
MSVRPNIQSLVLDGKELTVKGETDGDHMPTAVFVVVVQDAPAGQAKAVASAIADRVGSGWRAVLQDTEFKKGPAQTLGVEARIAPFESTTWVQSVTIV